ncbi:MAG: ABC transporter substrate-binding protein, partial [Dehalococcoidia bacterium]
MQTERPPITSTDLTRRGFLIGAAGSALLIACGSDDTSTPQAEVRQGSTTPNTTTDPPASTPPAAIRLVPAAPTELGAPAVSPPTASTSATAVPLGPAIAAYAKYGTDAAPGVFPRTIRHALGETRIAAPPSRVVVLDTGEMDTVVDLGLKPFGTIDWTGAGLPDYLAGSLQGVQIVGSIMEPNLEAVAALGPDLILTNRTRHEAIYEKLAAIAPSVLGERPGLVWRQNYELYARALGREQQGTQTVMQYEEHAKRLNAKLPNPRPTISVVRATATNLRYYQRSNFLGTILTDLGFPRPEGQNVDDFALNNQSLETIGRFGGGDVIVLSIIGGSS